MTGLLLTSNTMPVCTYVRNPGNATSNLYGPITRLGRTKEPASSEMVVRVTPVLVCVAVMSAPGNTAPVWSFTFPLIWAVACPQTFAELREKTRNTIDKYLTMLPQKRQLHTRNSLKSFLCSICERSLTIQFDLSNQGEGGAPL